MHPHTLLATRLHPNASLMLNVSLSVVIKATNLVEQFIHLHLLPEATQVAATLARYTPEKRSLPRGFSWRGICGSTHVDVDLCSMRVSHATVQNQSAGSPAKRAEPHRDGGRPQGQVKSHLFLKSLFFLWPLKC